MDPDVVAATQEAFKGKITKPKMSAKLLSRPPFRYLHDIVSAVTKATGFADGLFHGNELNGKAIKGKEEKLAYLKKIVACVDIANGSPIDLNLSKVIAGKEPEKTNAFLQTLALVAWDKSVDSKSCVSQVLDTREPVDESSQVREKTEGKCADVIESKNRADVGSKISANDGSVLGTKLEGVTDDIEDTASVVNGIISRPTCSAKLLSKPPFRFLHDIIIGIMNATQYREGLYVGDELNGKAIKGKDAKIDFLNKIIGAVESDASTSVDMNPKKVVAGKEPERTRRFLQTFAIVASNVGGGTTGAARESADEVSSKRADVGSKTSTHDDITSPHDTKISASRTSDLSSKLEGATDDIEDTASVVNGIISRPRCSAKLLSKPPFRFLHDIIIGIMNATQYREGLYVGDELNGKAIKGKDAKIDFLNKIIGAVESDASTSVDMNPKKVVAGKEPEHTRRFLQTFAIVASHVGAQDSASAKGTSSQAHNLGKARSQKHSETKMSREDADRESAEIAAAEKLATEREAAALERSRLERERRNAENESKYERPSADTSLAPAGDDQKIEFEPAVAERPKTKRLMRPTTARRRPPTIRQKVKVVEAKTEELLEDYRSKGVMLEGEDDSDSDPNDLADEGATAARKISEDESKIDGAEHGRLVRDILQDAESKKRERKPTTNSGKDEGIRMRRIGARRGETVSKKVDLPSLREQVQRLCRSTNPLANSIDFVHDDFEQMKKEFSRWKAVYDSFTVQTEKELQKTEETLQPLESELVKIEERITETRRRIDLKRAAIERNDKRIEDLLRMVVTQKSGGVRNGRAVHRNEYASKSDAK